MPDNNTDRPRLVVAEGRSESLALPPGRDMGKAPMQGDEGQPQPKEQPDLSSFATRAEVQSALNGLMARVAALMAPKTEMDSLAAAIANVARSSTANFVRRDEAEAIAKEAVPATLRSIDSGASPRTGNVLMLLPSPEGVDGGDSVFFGTPSVGLSVKGTKTLNYGIHAREYDSDGNLVDVGSETGGEDRTLKPTWDVARWI